MPVISMFYGVIVMMYYFDNRKHHLPHIYVKYGDQEAVIKIPKGGTNRGRTAFNLNEIGAGLD